MNAHKKPVELLAPAGNMEKLETALLYGADAVYAGGSDFSLRSKAGNFSLEELHEARKRTRELGRKLYVTLNIFGHNTDLAGIEGYLKELRKVAPDALIISDPGIIWLARLHAPEIPIHLSTQANATNWAACRFWKEQGVERVVLGREVSMPEIREISARGQVELEAFVHGAMCMAYSGRCMLSMALTGRSANSGSCTHPCRWEYAVAEKNREGEYMPVEEDERGTYIFNSKDLCILPWLDRFIDSGITSLKIEGRMKSIHYVATATKAYREALDLILSGGDFAGAVPRLMEELSGIGEREYTTGFYLEERDSQMQMYAPPEKEHLIRFLGKVLEVREDGTLLVEQRNKFSLGEELELLMPYGKNLSLTVEKLINQSGEPVESAPHPREVLLMNGVPGAVPGALLRRRRIADEA